MAKGENCIVCGKIISKIRRNTTNVLTCTKKCSKENSLALKRKASKKYEDSNKGKKMKAAYFKRKKAQSG